MSLKPLEELCYQESLDVKKDVETVWAVMRYIWDLTSNADEDIVYDNLATIESSVNSCREAMRNLKVKRSSGVYLDERTIELIESFRGVEEFFLELIAKTKKKNKLK